MRYEVEKQDADIEIRVSDTAGRTSDLLRSFHACQAGTCGCPSDQYDKLAAMDVDAGDDQVTLRLRPLPGERLDVAQLTTCLDHTITGPTADG